MASSTTKFLSRPSLSKVIFALPIALYVNDRFFSTHTIRDDSMEPTLRKGDVVLVRHVDFLPYYYIHGDEGLSINNLLSVDRAGDQLKQKEDDSFHHKNHSVLVEQETDRLKSLQMDISVGKNSVDAFTLWRSPPNALPGDLVLITNPSTFTPMRNHVRRLIGLPGQKVRSFQKIETIPLYSIWVEGEKKTQSSEDTQDSSIYGPVSKKLLIGQVQCIIWPPTRWGNVERIRPPSGRVWWP